MSDDWLDRKYKLLSGVIVRLPDTEVSLLCGLQWGEHASKVSGQWRSEKRIRFLNLIQN